MNAPRSLKHDFTLWSWVQMRLLVACWLIQASKWLFFDALLLECTSPSCIRSLKDEPTSYCAMAFNELWTLPDHWSMISLSGHEFRCVFWLLADWYRLASDFFGRSSVVAHISKLHHCFYFGSSWHCCTRQNGLDCLEGIICQIGKDNLLLPQAF